MKKCIIYILLCVLVATSCRSELDRKFDQLDEALRDRSEIEDSICRVACALREELSSSVDSSDRWDKTYALFSLYSTFQADSAVAYLDALESLGHTDPQKDFEVRYCRAIILSSLRDYVSAQDCLNAVDLSLLDEVNYARFYKAQLYIYGMMSADEMIPQGRKEELLRVRNQMRLTYLSCPGIEAMEKVRRQAMQMYQNSRASEAVPILLDLLEKTSDPRDKLDVTYSLSEAYFYAGDSFHQQYWMAQNAINAIKIGNKTTLSLYELCNLLFQEGRLSRASKYCKIAVENAISSGFSSFILNSAYSQLIIASAVEASQNHFRHSMTIVVFVLLCLVCLSVILLFKLKRQKDTILRINDRLGEAGRVKEGYLFRYMVMAVKYLDSVEGLRRSVRKAIKTGDTDTINTLLRDPRYNSEEYTRFYQEFDRTFLGIYPDFVQKVNQLLPPEERFTLRGQERMPTDLRVLAAIKLGFTDSGSIAEFLSCAPSSVYTYRSRVKRSALCPANRFEDIIKEF